MKNRIMSLLQIVVNLLCVPIYFIKFIVGIGHLPSEDGGIVEKYFYHSPFENLTDMDCGWLMYVSLVLILIAITTSVFSIVKKDNSKLQKSSLVVSIISFVIAVLAILFSTTIGRGY